MIPVEMAHKNACHCWRGNIGKDKLPLRSLAWIKEKSFLKNLFFKMFVMENEVEAVGFSKEWIIVEHGDLVLPDKDLQLREAEVRNDIGDIPGALEALGDDPDEIEKKMTVIGDAKAAEAASQGTAGNPLEEEGEEDEVVVE